MEWQLALVIILGSFFVVLALGMPVALGFMVINVVALSLLWGGAGLETFGDSMRESVISFVLLPLPLFILMGEVLFHSGLAPLILDALDKLLVRLPGRLALLAVGGGTLFATLTGSSVGSVALLGSVLVPEMEKRGYKKSMSLGPILGSGGLAIMIPPSGLAILLAALSKVSVGKMLIGIIIPGLLLAVLYATYIIVRCRLQPSIAPTYELVPTPVLVKLKASVRYILPIGLIVFLVIGVIFLGIATPTEAAATGALGTFILAAFYKRLNWQMVKKSIRGTLRIAVMIFVILVGAKAFSQILAYTGIGPGLRDTIVALPLPSVAIIVIMQVIVLILGTFMEAAAIMMVTLPVYMPIVHTLGFDPVWFAIIFLLNIEMAQTTPPFGLSLYVMKGVAPPGTTLWDVIKAGIPFLGGAAIVMALVMSFPSLALWLPAMMD